MAISRVLGASLVSDLDRQGVDLQFTTSGNTLVYMDFANFRMGVNQENPQQSLHLNGNLLVANGSIYTSANVTYDIGQPDNWFNTLYVNSISATTFVAGNLSGVLLTNAQPNITSVGTLTGLTVDGNLTVVDYLLPNSNVSGSIGSDSLWWSEIYANVITAEEFNGTLTTGSQPNITNLANVTIEELTISSSFEFDGNLTVNRVDADEIYDNGNRVITEVTTINITGDATGSGNVTDIALTLQDTGVIAGVYGSADDEFADRIPKITVDSKGRITNIANVTLTQVGNVNFNDTTISANNNITIGTVNEGNIYLSPTGSGIVYMVDTDAVKLPTGDTSQRPDQPEEGYFRYNVDRNSIEFWNGDSWESPGVTPISSQVLIADGIEDTFTLNDESTADSLLVMINGTLQQPLVSYQVSGNLITFSEVPLTTDVIEVRNIASGATTVTALAIGGTSVSITPGNINLSGNLIPAADITYDIGSSDKQWRDLFLSGNTIHLGGATLSTNGSTLEFTPAGGSAIDLSGDTDPTSISNGASNVQVTADYVNIAISSTNIASFSTSGITTLGNISAAYIIGNGSQLTGLPAGYANANVATYLPTYTGTLGGNLAAANLTGIVSIAQGGTGAATTADALNNLLPSGEQTGYVLTTGGAGTYYWATAGVGGGATVGQSLTTLRQSNVATAGQTVFDLVNDLDYTPGTGQLRVYIDGTRQFPSAYSETSNVSFTLSAGVSAGTEVFAEIDAFSTFENFANLTYASNIGNIAAEGLTVQSAIESLEINKAPLASPVFSGVTTANGNLVVQGNLSINESMVTNDAVIANNLTVGGSPSVTLYNPGFLYFGENPPDSGFYNATFDGYALEVAQVESIIVGDVVTIYFSEGASTFTVTGVYFEEESQKYLYFNDPVPLGTSPAGEFVSMDIAARPPILQANSLNSSVTLTGNITAGNLFGTILTSSQPNITSIGTLETLNVLGLTTLSETTETLDTKSGVTGTVVHDFSTTAIWYYSNIAGPVTANFTNIPTTNNRITSVSIVINQGVIGRIVNGLQINGAAQTIRWQNNTVPTASANRIDVFTFSLLRAANAWTVLGSATSHG
jgi:hypothetical protein